MLEQNRNTRSLKAFLYMGLVGISVVFAITGYGLRLYVESRLSEQAEAQVRALSRHRAQQSLLLSLLDEEVGLRGYLATGDPKLLNTYYQGSREEADAIRNTLDNLDPADEEEATPLLQRIQAMVRAWHEEVADPMVRDRAKGTIVNLKAVMEKEKQHFEAIREASESLLRFLDGRDNARLNAVEQSLANARWISIAAMVVVFLAGLQVSRWILRRVADPLVELAEAARAGRAFPEPETIQSVREVEVLSRALFDLDVRVREREQTLRQDHDEAEAIREFAELVQRIEQEDDLLIAMEQALRRLVRADRVQILLRPPIGDGLEARSPRLEPEEIDKHRILREAVACRAMHTGHSVSLDSKAPTACICPLGVPAKGSYLCLPLLASGKVMGLVNLQSSRSGHFDVALRRISNSCVSVAAAALQAIRALNLAKEEALRDGLTGAFNRRFLSEVLAKEIDHAKRGNASLSALMFDIDHFKQFNDTFGHEGGDRVLLAFAHCLQEQVRMGDLVARYGGEEFAVLLPDTTYEVAMNLGERLRRRVEALTLVGPDFPSGCHITTSIGVATYPAHGEDGESLLAAADKALYGAKGSGRNRVVGFCDIGL